LNAEYLSLCYTFYGDLLVDINKASLVVTNHNSYCFLSDIFPDYWKKKIL
jgi:hypothetical protein